MAAAETTAQANTNETTTTKHVVPSTSEKQIIAGTLFLHCNRGVYCGYEGTSHVCLKGCFGVCQPDNDSVVLGEQLRLLGWILNIA